MPPPRGRGLHAHGSIDKPPSPTPERRFCRLIAWAHNRSKIQEQMWLAIARACQFHLGAPVLIYAHGSALIHSSDGAPPHLPYARKPYLDGNVHC